MRHIFAVLGIALMAVFVVPSVAHADERDVSSYTPDTPTDPSLAGSTVEPVCDINVPWIYYDVILTDPDDQVTDTAAVLFITDGTNSVELGLGELQNGRLEGRVLWPGTTVDENGDPISWPGWVLENGTWVEHLGNYAWTRGQITAEIRVNPSVSVPLSYPPVPSPCAVVPGPTGSTAALATTGLGAAVLPIAIAGGAALLLGLTLLVVQRRRSRA